MVQAVIGGPIGGITGEGFFSWQAEGRIAGAGALRADAQVLAPIQASARLAGAGSLRVDAQSKFIWLGAARFAGSGALSADAQLKGIWQGNALLGGAGSLKATAGIVTRANAAKFSGVASFTASGVAVEGPGTVFGAAKTNGNGKLAVETFLLVAYHGGARSARLPTRTVAQGHTDIHIVNHASLDGIWDDWLQLPNGSLDESQALANAVKVALLTDRLAERREILPDPDSVNRRGWWGDLEAETVWDGWPIGCKNWLLFRAKITGTAAREGSTLVRAETYTRQALQPLIDKRMCTSIDVTATRAEIHRINVLVKIYRGPLEEIELQFQDLWTLWADELDHREIV